MEKNNKITFKKFRLVLQFLDTNTYAELQSDGLGIPVANRPNHHNSDSDNVCYLRDVYVFNKEKDVPEVRVHKDDFEVWHFNSQVSINGVTTTTIRARTESRSLDMNDLKNTSAVLLTDYVVAGIPERESISGIITSIRLVEEPDDKKIDARIYKTDTTNTNKIVGNSVEPMYRWYEIVLSPRISYLDGTKQTRMFSDSSLMDVTRDIMASYGLIGIPEENLAYFERDNLETNFPYGLQNSKNAFNLYEKDEFGKELRYLRNNQIKTSEYYYFSSNKTKTYKYPFLLQKDESDLEFLIRVWSREGFYFYSAYFSYGENPKEKHLPYLAGHTSDIWENSKQDGASNTRGKYYYDVIIITDLNGKFVKDSKDPIAGIKDYKFNDSHTLVLSQKEVLKDPDIKDVIQSRYVGIKKGFANISLHSIKQPRDINASGVFQQESLVYDSAGQETNGLQNRNATGKKIIRMESFYVDVRNIASNKSHDNPAMALRQEVVLNTVKAYDSSTAAIMSFNSIDISFGVNQILTYEMEITGELDNYLVVGMSKYGVNSEIDSNLVLSGEIKKVIGSMSMNFTNRVTLLRLKDKLNATTDFNIEYHPIPVTNPRPPNHSYGVICSPRYDFDTKEMTTKTGEIVFKYIGPQL